MSVSSVRETRTKMVKPNALSQAATIKIKITIIEEFLWKYNAWKIQDKIVASNLSNANRIDWRWKTKLNKARIKKENDKK